MANLLDYLDWRGDLSFSADPFNIVDNLILSELAYVDFGGIVPGQDSRQGVGIEEADEEFWRRHTVEEVEKSRTLYHLAPMLLKKLAKSPRFAGMQLFGYTNTVSETRNEQLSAITFRFGNGLTYVAFRGTDDTITGWKEDFTLSFLRETPGQRNAAEYLSRQITPEDRDLIVGGHSKGGNFAVYASAFCDPSVRRTIRRIYTNDGPGFLEGITRTDEYSEILPHIISIIPEESVFGLLLDSGYPHIVVKSSNKGIWQHDALSWEVLGNRFVEASSTNQNSVFIEKTLERWLSGISLEERRQFVDAFFEMIEASGKETVSSFQEGRLKAFFDLLNSYQNLDSREKSRIRDIIQKLFRAGTEVLKQDISEGKELI